MTVRLEPPAWPAPRPPAEAAPGRQELAGFLAALRPRLVGPRLSSVLGGSRPCHVLDAKYEPGVRALVLYQYGSDLVRGDLVPSTDAHASTGLVGPSGLRVSQFPHDPDLPALPVVMSGSQIGRHLADALPGLASVDRRALRRRCHLRLLRYRAGKRATVWLSAAGLDADYVAKVYHDPGKAAAVAGEAGALAEVAATSTTLRLASSVASLLDLGVVVQEVVPGTPLHGLLGGPRGQDRRLATAMTHAAHALADLHSGEVASLRRRPVDKELHRFVLRADRIASVDAPTGSVLGELAHRLLATYREIPAGPVGLVHGDCKPSQFLLDGPTVYLLDLDHCGLGDQATDVGTFLASMRQLAVREALVEGGPARASQLSALAAVFRQAYLRSRHEDGLDLRVRWYEAVALQRKALRAFARAPLSPLPAALVAAGHRCLDELGRELA